MPTATRTMRAHQSARNRDFLRACRRIIDRADPSTPLTIKEVAAAAAASPAPEFYLSYEYALRIISSPEPKRQCATAGAVIRRRRELLARLDAMLAANPGMDRRDALVRVLESPASSFFISPETGRRIISAHARRPR